MKTSQNGMSLIKLFEGCRLKAYVDPGTGGLPITIGFGNTARKDGSKFKLGDVITQERANELFLELLPKYESTVDRNIKVALNQNQFDALVSFCWNCGSSASLFRLINQKATDEVIYDWWINHFVTGGGKLLPGLIKRRRKEADLFIKK
jgi:lysozyme